ncbi:MAG: hypothetical protein COA79_20165 [Planctomycetota bacterium]|nr:MAG: hypothetical protein COA79_20165 [Planctomycetota bacterium]
MDIHLNQSIPTWKDAEDWRKDSVIDGVKNIVDGIVRTPGDSHAAWMETKKEEGWEYGEVKDADNKIHPCMVEFDDLPAEQKSKDFIFLAIVKSAFDMDQDAV